MQVKIKKSTLLKHVFLKDMSISISTLSLFSIGFICLERGIRSLMGFYDDGTQFVMYFTSGFMLTLMGLMEVTIIEIDLEKRAEEAYEKKKRMQARKARDREIAKKQRKEMAEVNAAIERQKQKNAG
jgi:hypothetical protein